MRRAIAASPLHKLYVPFLRANVWRLLLYPCTDSLMVGAFYPRDAMHIARSLRQRRVCLSVRVSVTRRYCACLAEQKHDCEMYTI